MLDKESEGAATGVSFEQMEKEYRANKDLVVNLLIDNCLEVDCEIPRVVKGQFE